MYGMHVHTATNESNWAQLHRANPVHAANPRCLFKLVHPGSSRPSPAHVGLADLGPRGATSGCSVPYEVFNATPHLQPAGVCAIATTAT